MLLTKNCITNRAVLLFGKVGNPNIDSYYIGQYLNFSSYKHFFLKNDKKLYYFKKLFKNVILRTQIKTQILKNHWNLIKWKHSKYFFVGLGYKIFVRGRIVFIYIGLTHYTRIFLPKSVFIFPKKKRIYILSPSLKYFSKIMYALRMIRKRDIYKSKGLLETKTYKNFIRMKTGKKKQY